MADQKNENSLSEQSLSSKSSLSIEIVVMVDDNEWMNEIPSDILIVCIFNI